MARFQNPVSSEPPKEVAQPSRFEKQFDAALDPGELYTSYYADQNMWFPLRSPESRGLDTSIRRVKFVTVVKSSVDHFLGLGGLTLRLRVSRWGCVWDSPLS